MHAPLVVTAHGSRDPRSAATIRALCADIDAHVSFLDLSEPLLTDVLRSLASAGHREAVVVPLLLGSAYHARVDLPALVREAPLRVSIADVLGIDPVLEDVALDRLTEAGADPADPSLGVVLAGVGSSRPAANRAVIDLAGRWNARYPMRVAPAFATARPDVRSAIAKLRARGAERIAVASWFLAPGLLPSRIAAQARAVAPDVVLAHSLAPDPRIADLILRRHGDILPAAA
ncbi:MAG TPA: sirohydrochlorin chelatase [Amycolatopsis sp.]|nr:sirohydrochlorin chelatase [Amycolatopsis sp.]